MDFEQLDKELHQDKGFYTQQFELNKKIQQLENENAELKIANREFTEDYKLQQKAINTLNDSGLKLMEENKELKYKLANQKYLDYDSMEDIFNNVIEEDWEGSDTNGVREISENEQDTIIAKILDLVVNI